MNFRRNALGNKLYGQTWTYITPNGLEIEGAQAMLTNNTRRRRRIGSGPRYLPATKTSRIYGLTKRYIENLIKAGICVELLTTKGSFLGNNHYFLPEWFVEGLEPLVHESLSDEEMSIESEADYSDSAYSSDGSFIEPDISYSSDGSFIESDKDVTNNRRINIVIDLTNDSSDLSEDFHLSNENSVEMSFDNNLSNNYSDVSNSSSDSESTTFEW